MSLRSLLGIICAFWLFTGCVTMGGSVAQNDQPFTTEEEFRTWFAYYYQQPHPEKLTAALKYMRANGYLDEADRDTRDMSIIASVFLSRVFSDNQSSLKEWAAHWQKLGQPEWYVVLVALRLSDSDEAKVVMQANLTRVDAEHQKRLASMQKHDIAALDPMTAEVVSPRQINLLWAAFSATGDERYVRRVISYVHYYGDQEDDNKNIIGEAALMSLANNALQHDLVSKLCVQVDLETQDPKTRVLLGAMLSAIADIAKGEGSGQMPDGGSGGDGDGSGRRGNGGAFTH